MEARNLRRMSVAEYVRLDRSSDERWEYVGGEAFVMSSSPEHNVVEGNLFAMLRDALAGTPCLAFPDGQKVATPRTHAFHYPDLSVFCGAVIRDEDDDHALVNPTLLAEVLSPTTADYDRGGKFVHYRTIETLREYVIVSIEERVVERYRRLPSGEWLMTEVHEGELELTSVGAKLVVAGLWRDVDRVARSANP